MDQKPRVFRCPKCTGENYYGRLDLPTTRRRPCPNCGSRLVVLEEKR